MVPLQLSSGKSSSRIVGLVAQPYDKFTGNSSFLAVFVGKVETFLASKEGFPVWKELEVNVVEDESVGLVGPIIEVEEVTHVVGRANRSCPLSFPPSRWAHQAE